MRFRVGRLGDELIAEWIGVARLVASRDGTRRDLVFEDHVPSAERRKLERGDVRLLLRQLAGEISLHGSAVTVGGRAVVMLGTSGRGKSTLAAALCRRGAELLADDAVGLTFTATSVDVEPAETDHWLDETSQAALQLLDPTTSSPSAKRPIAARTSRTAVAAAAIFELRWAPDGPPRAMRRRGVEALASVLPHVARFVLDSPRHQRTELEHLERLVREVPVYVLERPRSFDLLTEGIDIIDTLCFKETGES
ncbi:MAG: hypothetical protein KF764_20130 [Labilithrix sp.]|nr:hypothetical protein [Labilithrix sp.]